MNEFGIVNQSETFTPGLAPRVTRDAIENQIQEEWYYRLDGTTITICVLVLDNGFKVIGESACVSPENFDAEYGQNLAREKAVDKCWELFGFALAERLKKEKDVSYPVRPGEKIF